SGRSVDDCWSAGSSQRKRQSLLALINGIKLPVVGQDCQPAFSLPGCSHYLTPHEAVPNDINGIAFLGSTTAGQQQVVGVGEGALVLTKVYSVRPGVVGGKLDVVAHAMVQLQHHGVIPAVDVAENSGQGTEATVRATDK